MLLDSNVLIYAARPSSPEHGAVREFLLRSRGAPFYVSELSRVEAFGYHAIGETERAALLRLFTVASELPVTPALDLAAELRRERRGLKTVDAVVAATALIHGLTLVTRNVRDFEWNTSLTVVDPLGVP